MKIKTLQVLLCMAALIISGCTKDPLVPLQDTNRIDVGPPAASAIGQNNAVITGLVTTSQGDQIQDKGICWSTVSNPVITGMKQSGGPGAGTFSSTLTGLLPGTIYYIRTYVQTDNEVLYSSNQSLRTLDYQLASVQTISVGSITQTDAMANASVLATGGGTVSQRGVCWSTAQFPTTANSRTLSGSGTGSFSASITSLLPGTTYYLRAYAINQAGTSYGAQISFTTQPVRLATVSTVSSSNITRTSATFIASITADGGGTVTSKGIVYSATTSAPVINSSSMFSNGVGIGSAGGSISGLSPATTYYVRAFAINAAGVSYGSLSSFRTLQ